MSQREAPDEACIRFEELSRSRAGGAPLSAADSRELEAHRQDCPDCRRTEQLFGALRHRAETPAVEPLDDLWAQRWINDLLAQVDAAPAKEDAPPEADAAPAEEVAPHGAGALPGEDVAGEGQEPALGSLGAARPRRAAGRGRAAAAVIAVGLVLAVASTMVYRAERHPVIPATAGGEVHRAATAAYGRLLLRSGEVRGPAGAIEAGAVLGAPSMLDVREGLAALQLREAVALRLERATRVRLEPTPGDGAAVRLEEGSLVAVVTPGLPGARFSVRTPHGEVRVTGTHFGVVVTERVSQVEVLFGSVVVSSPGAPDQRVGAGQRLRLGEGHPSALDDAARRRLRERADTLGLLASERASGLRVASRPARAQVRLDGVLLGRTPLSASVRPGHRRLAVTAPEHEAVTEQLAFPEGSAFDRDFELQRLTPVPAEPVPTGAEGLLPERGARPIAPGATLERPISQVVPPRARTTASEVDEGWRLLLSQAQTRRAAQDWAGAARAYRALIQRYPARPEAHTALVSLGFVLMEHLGQPAAALASFERYLRDSRSGPLGREASWGRAQALGALGRQREERQALQAFLRTFPGSVHEGRIRARLGQLGAPVPRPDAPMRLP